MVTSAVRHRALSYLYRASAGSW